MKDRDLTLENIDIKDVYKDLHSAIYMLHHLDGEAFSKEEIRNVAFSLKVTANSIEKMIDGKK